jgi:lysozyme
VAETNAAQRLLALFGAGGLTLLLTFIPLEESGRRTEAIVTETHVEVRHIAGKQYLRAYLDAVGVPTACDGITRKVRLGQTYTEAQCADMLMTELLVHAEEVKACAPGLFASGMEYARVAGVSLAYNIGARRFCTSTAAKLFRAGALAKACDAMLPWNKGRVSGKLTVLPGLRKRRAAEREICLTGTPGRSTATLRARIDAVRR